MTELRAFLSSLYDSLSEAEVEALLNGQQRLESLLAEGAIPKDVPLPVYHASDMEVTLNVRLEAVQRKDGVDMVMKTVEPDDPSAVTLTLDVFELIDRFDLEPTRRNDNDPSDEDNQKDQPVDVVQGIGPAYSLRLKQEGIETLTDLVELSPDTIADLVSGEQIDISPERTAGWIEEAQGLRKVLSEVEGEQPVEMVDGIGPTFGRRLREQNIEHLSDLVGYTPEAIADIVSTEEMTISAQQAAGWLEQAELVLDSLESVESRAAIPGGYEEQQQERGEQDQRATDSVDDTNNAVEGSGVESADRTEQSDEEQEEPDT